MGVMASQITSLTIVYSTVYSDADKITSKLRVTGLCAGNSPVTVEFPAQRASNAENVSIWWRHHATSPYGPAMMANISLIERTKHIGEKWSNEASVTPIPDEFNVIIWQGLVMTCLYVCVEYTDIYYLPIVRWQLHRIKTIIYARWLRFMNTVSMYCKVHLRWNAGNIKAHTNCIRNISGGQVAKRQYLRSGGWTYPP